jgi:hypothetical protein
MFQAQFVCVRRVIKVLHKALTYALSAWLIGQPPLWPTLASDTQH